MELVIYPSPSLSAILPTSVSREEAKRLYEAEQCDTVNPITLDPYEEDELKTLIRLRYRYDAKTPSKLVCYKPEDAYQIIKSSYESGYDPKELTIPYDLSAIEGIRRRYCRFMKLDEKACRATYLRKKKVMNENDQLLHQQAIAHTVAELNAEPLPLPNEDEYLDYVLRQSLYHR